MNKVDLKIEDYNSVINKVVNSVVSKHRAYHLKDDLYNEAVVMFYEAVNSYTKKKGEFSKHLSIHLRYGLKAYVASNLNYTLTNDKLDNLVITSNNDLDVDNEILDEYLILFNNLTLLEKFIIVCYFYENYSIRDIHNIVPLNRGKISNIIEAYKHYVQEELL
jgi:DNA-directed RNA polymerase specialized sigma subunit